MLTVAGIIVLVIALIVVGAGKGGVVSHKQLVDRARISFQRFPLSVTSAVLTAVLSTVAVYNYTEPEDCFRPISLIATGISLFMAAVCIAEATAISRGLLAALAAAALALFAIGTHDDTDAVFLIRIAQFNLATHLLVAIGPFVRSAKLHAFWMFNSRLFVRMVWSAVFCALIFFGISISLGAIQFLLDLKLDGRIYFVVWIWLTSVLNTLLFLSGVPEKLDQLEDHAEYPRGLYQLMHYIFVPFALLDLAILYVYLGKIAVQMSLPKGMVAWLVCTFCVGGTFVWLLTFAAKADTGKWFRFFRERFFYVLLPLLGLLAISIWMRVSEYGITERRYLLIVLNVWLALIAVYFAILKKKDIRIIPFTLLVLSVLTMGGPWSAYAVSIRSQLNRLTKDLTTIGLSLPLNNNSSAAATTTREQLRDISSSFEYLLSTHGAESVMGLFEENSEARKLLALEPPLDSRDRTRSRSILPKVFKSVGLEYVEYIFETGDQSNFSYFVDSSELPQLEPITGYNYIIRNAELYRSVEQNADGLKISFNQSELIISRFDSPICVVPLGQAVKAIRTIRGFAYSMSLDDKLMRYKYDCEDVSVRVDFKYLNGSIKDDVVRISSLTADVLLKWNGKSTE